MDQFRRTGSVHERPFLVVPGKDPAIEIVDSLGAGLYQPALHGGGEPRTPDTDRAIEDNCLSGGRLPVAVEKRPAPGARVYPFRALEMTDGEFVFLAYVEEQDILVGSQLFDQRLCCQMFDIRIVPAELDPESWRV